MLSPADMIVHAAAHLFADGDLAGGLRNLWDIDRLLREFGDATTSGRRLRRDGLLPRSARGRLATISMPTPVARRSRPGGAPIVSARRLLARDGWGRATRPRRASASTSARTAAHAAGDAGAASVDQGAAAARAASLSTCAARIGSRMRAARCWRGISVRTKCAATMDRHPPSKPSRSSAGISSSIMVDQRVGAERLGRPVGEAEADRDARDAGGPGGIGVGDRIADEGGAAAAGAARSPRAAARDRACAPAACRRRPARRSGRPSRARRAASRLSAFELVGADGELHARAGRARSSAASSPSNRRACRRRCAPHNSRGRSGSLARPAPRSSRRSRPAPCCSSARAPWPIMWRTDSGRHRRPAERGRARG